MRLIHIDILIESGNIGKNGSIGVASFPTELLPLTGSKYYPLSWVIAQINKPWNIYHKERSLRHSITEYMKRIEYHDGI
jgi:hypothetical protein